MSNGQKFLYHVTPSGMEICIQNTLLSSALDQAAVQPLNRVHIRAKESCLQHDCIQEALSSRALGLWNPSARASKGILHTIQTIWAYTEVWRFMSIFYKG